MSSPQTTASDLAAVADAVRGHQRFVLTTHENPDGDALGSLLAAKLALDQLGKDNVMVLHGDAPLPGEYAFMPLAELRRRWPDDVADRVLLALDCANESRIADPEVLGRVPLSIDDSLEKPAACRCPPPPDFRAIADTSSSSMLARRLTRRDGPSERGGSRMSTAMSAPSTARR